MNLSTLAQLSMFFPKERRMGKLVGLYAGSKDGFSMGMFESKVLKYPGISKIRKMLTSGPSILLLRGTTEDESTENDRKEVLFGAYISTPWKSSTKGQSLKVTFLTTENFGDKSSILFQLLPTHSVYPSAPYHTQFAYFNPRIGLGFGSPPPQLRRRQSLTSQYTNPTYLRPPSFPLPRPVFRTCEIHTHPTGSYVSIQFDGGGVFSQN